MEKEIRQFTVEPSEGVSVGIRLRRREFNIPDRHGRFDYTRNDLIGEVTTTSAPVSFHFFMSVPVETMSRQRQLFIRADGRDYYISSKGELSMVSKNGTKRLVLGTVDLATSVSLNQPLTLTYTETAVFVLGAPRKTEQVLELSRVEAIRFSDEKLPYK